MAVVNRPKALMVTCSDAMAINMKKQQLCTSWYMSSGVCDGQGRGCLRYDWIMDGRHVLP